MYTFETYILYIFVFPRYFGVYSFFGRFEYMAQKYTTKKSTSKAFTNTTLRAYRERRRRRTRTKERKKEKIDFFLLFKPRPVKGGVFNVRNFFFLECICMFIHVHASLLLVYTFMHACMYVWFIMYIHRMAHNNCLNKTSD